MSGTRKILLVDDEAELRHTLVEQFALTDEFEVIEAGTAASAVQLAKAERLDLLVMDVGLHWKGWTVPTLMAGCSPARSESGVWGS